MLSNIREAVRAPVEQAYAAAAGMPLVEGVLGTKLGLADTFLSADRTLLSAANGFVSNIPILNLSLEGGVFQNGILGIESDLPQVRGVLIKTLIQVTKLPTDALENFLEVLETVSLGVPSGELLREDVRGYFTQRSILDTYVSIETTKLNLFRETLDTLKGLLPAGEGGFMQRFNTGILDGVRTELLDGTLKDGPLLRPARTYFNNVFPVAGEFAETDAYMNQLSTELATTLGVESFPMDSLSRILSFKFGLVNSLVDVAAGVVVPLADVGTDLVKFGVDVSGALLSLIPVLPQLTVDVIFELLTIVGDITEGLITTKIGALEFIARLKLDLVATILEIPLTIFTDLTFVGVDVLTGLWDEIRGMLTVYTDYTGALGFDSEMFPLSQFAGMTKNLLSVPAASFSQ